MLVHNYIQIARLLGRLKFKFCNLYCGKMNKNEKAAFFMSMQDEKKISQSLQHVLIYKEGGAKMSTAENSSSFNIAWTIVNSICLMAGKL